jgi:uncharacterized protein (DUF433 family)
MPLVIEAEPVPLAVDADGAYRVAGTRVTLDTVVAAYQEGATPEEIVDQYPSIKLDHVYAVIGYYLRHREEVEAYLGDRAKYAADVRSAAEKTWPPHGIRDRLMARQASGRQ